MLVFKNGEIALLYPVDFPNTFTIVWDDRPPQEKILWVVARDIAAVYYYDETGAKATERDYVLQLLEHKLRVPPERRQQI